MQNCDTSHTSCGTETWVMWWTPLSKKEFISFDGRDGVLA